MIDRDAVVENLGKCIRFVSDHIAQTPAFHGWSNVEMAMRDALELLKEQGSEEKRILKIVWDILHSGVSTDTEADQDWVYEQIRNQVHQVY